jgi:hypothetical protein
MAQKKSKAQVESNMLAVAQELLNGDQTNLETLQEVLQTTVSTMEVKDPHGLLEVEEVKVKKIGIGSTIIEMILAQPELSNKEILEAVQKKFETAKTSYACIAWYKSDLRKKGLIGPRMFAKKAKTEVVSAE